MWTSEQILEGKNFDPIFAHAIVRKYPELDNILWDACEVDSEYWSGVYAYGVHHNLKLYYRGELMATLREPELRVQQGSFYKYIMNS